MLSCSKATALAGFLALGFATSASAAKESRNGLKNDQRASTGKVHEGAMRWTCVHYTGSGVSVTRREKPTADAVGSMMFERCYRD